MARGGGRGRGGRGRGGQGGRGRRGGKPSGRGRKSRGPSRGQRKIRNPGGGGGSRGGRTINDIYTPSAEELALEKTRKSYEDNLKSFNAAWDSFGKQQTAFGQTQQTFKENQDLWNAQWKSHMETPRQIDVGGVNMLDSQANAHLTDLTNTWGQTRAADLGRFHTAASAYGTPQGTSGVKTVRGVTGKRLQASDPNADFNRSGLRIKGVNI